MRRFFSLIGALCISIVAFAQYDMNAPLPVNPEIRIGKLANGMTYYIQHNEEPKNRADFYIMHHVGALQEEDNQNGLAHFLEHMAFNGTKNFPGKGIINTLQRHGMSFGGNINAYTSQDRTVYYLNNINVEDKPLIDTCIMVLRDWSHYIALEDEEIDNERGVISEEWRTRRNAQFRINHITSPIMFGQTRYTTRDVIGDYEIINNFEYETIRKFYHDWYRTDLQGIAIVGDIDVDEIEAKIKEYCGSIPAVENPLQKEKIVLPENKEPLYALATDKELTNSSVAIYMVHPREDTHTHGEMRQSMIQSYYNSMLSSRLSEKIQKGDQYLLGAKAGEGGYVDGYGCYMLSVNARPNMECEALESAFTEVIRAKKFGFNESEFKRVKANRIAGIEKAEANKDKISNSTIVKELLGMFIDGNISINPDYYYAFSRYLLNNITLEDVNNYAHEACDFQNMKIIVTGPVEGVKHATKEEILTSMAKVINSNIEAYADNEVVGKLIDEELTGSPIVKEEKLPVFDAVKWTLGNGMIVVYAKANYEKNSVSVSSTSDGGLSLYDVDILPAASLATQFMGAFGVGKYSNLDLKRVLNGKSVSIALGLKNYNEGIGAASVTKDMETMFQMIYLYFENPRFDQTQFDLIKDRSAIQIENTWNLPGNILQREYNKIATCNHPRNIEFTADMMRDLKLEDIEKVFRDRFADASDFTFFVVGDAEEDQVRPLVEKYLGSVKDIKRKEHWKDNKVRGPKGHTQKNIHIPFETPKATVLLQYNRDYKWKYEDKFTASVLKGILDLRFTEDIREKEGGTYGVSCKALISEKPKKGISAVIQFDTDPSKAAHLKECVFNVIDKVMKEGVTEEEVSKVVSNMLKGRESSKAHNSFVQSVVTTYVLDGIDNSDPKNYEDILNNMTPEKVQKYAQKLFSDKTNLIDLIFTSDDVE